MRDHLQGLAAAIGFVKHLRTLAFSAALALLPVALSIGVSAAAPTTSVTKLLDRHTLSDATCIRLTHHTGCYVESGVTQTSANNSALIDVFVRPVSAWTSCSGVQSYWQSYYSWTGLQLANSNMRYAYCYDSGGVQITYGPYCHQNSIIGYGTGVNHCSGNNYKVFPGWAEDSWYLYPYATPWWHINNLQQVLQYPTWASWSGCTEC